jgi:Fur family ferric uptake transcriptional regulator
VTTPHPEEHTQAGPPARGPRARGTRTRGTRQAQALAAALDSLPGFCSAQEIHAELRRKGEQVGLATVYRHLQALSERGSIDAIRDANGETLYRQCETSVHHHHLTCRNCGRSVEVEGRAVEQWAERVAADAGFTDVGHTVELFGLCPQCAKLSTGHGISHLSQDDEGVLLVRPPVLECPLLPRNWGRSGFWGRYRAR